MSKYSKNTHAKTGKTEMECKVGLLKTHITVVNTYQAENGKQSK